MDVTILTKRTRLKGYCVKDGRSRVDIWFKTGLLKVAYYSADLDIAFLYSYPNLPDGELPERSRAADEWARRPYVVLPQDDGSALVIVPAWLDLQVGWLVNETGSHRIYRVDHYALWAGLVPEEFSDLVELPGLNLMISGDHLIGPEKDLEEAWKKYREFLLRRDEKGIKIKEGERWNLLLALVRDGVLPFMPTPVEVRNKWRTNGLELRDYQKVAFERFLRTGAVTVTWPPGAGKTTFAVACIAAVSGKTLVVVPSVSILRRWADELRRWIPSGPRISLLYSGSNGSQAADIIISTYQSALKRFVGSDREFDLLVVDEAHHLPADTFSKLATIRAKYRIALTASPFREDGRTELIYALGGFPVATGWEDLMKRGIVTKPEVVVYVTNYKLQALNLLMKKILKDWKDGTVIVYCDYIDEGRQVAAFLENVLRTDVPFVYGETSLRERYEMLEKHRVIVATRVFDEGMDIPDLVASVEYSFLFGSRRQELQRAGRLMHSLWKGVKHYVIMTPEEYESYRKRFLPLIGRGITVRVGDLASLMNEVGVKYQLESAVHEGKRLYAGM
jgi:DNA excision repair protein ERCC-3